MLGALPEEVELPVSESLEATVARLEARLARLEAVHAIQNLKSRYAQLVDQRFRRGKVVDGERLAVIAEEIAGLFVPDGVWDAGPPLGKAEGRDAIIARLASPSLVFSWHYFLKPEIHVDPDGRRGRARWDILSPCTTKDGTPHWMAGFEDDEYVLGDDGVWRHESMKLTTVFMAPHEVAWTRVFV